MLKILHLKQKPHGDTHSVLLPLNYGGGGNFVGCIFDLGETFFQSIWGKKARMGKKSISHVKAGGREEGERNRLMTLNVGNHVYLNDTQVE